LGGAAPELPAFAFSPGAPGVRDSVAQVDTSVPEEPAPSEPRVPSPSAKWRVQGVIWHEGAESAAAVLLVGGGAYRRVAASGCARDREIGWSCVVDGELVTDWTGPPSGMVSGAAQAMKQGAAQVMP